MSITRLDTAAAVAATTLSFSVSAGSDRLLVVGVAIEDSDNAEVTSIDYGGQAMVFVRTENANPGGPNARADVWYLLEAGIAAASGTTIDPTYSPGTPDGIILSAASYEGALQTSGVVIEDGGAFTGSSSPNPITTVDLTESSGNLILAAGVNGQSTTASWQSDLTEQTDQQHDSSTGSMADRLSTTEANVTIELTWASQNRAAIVSVHFAQADVGDVPCFSEASATSSDTSNSTSYEAIDGMNLTPGGGDYLAWFSTSVNDQNSLPETISIALFVDGTIVAHTEREITFNASLEPTTFMFAGTHAFVQPTDGQVVDVRWKTSRQGPPTTMTVLQRTLNLIQLNAADIDEVTATGDDTTTSTSFTAMNSMQITPGAGRYVLFFTASAEGSDADDDVAMAVFVDGVEQSHTERHWNQEDSIFGSSFCYAIAAEVNPGASEVVEIQWFVEGGTGTVHERTLTLWELVEAAGKTPNIEEASATAETTTTSTSFELLNSMTLTPVADTRGHLAIFTSYWHTNSQSGSLEAVIVEGTTEITHTQRASGSDASTPFMDHAVASNGIVNPDGIEDVEVHWRRSSSGTTTGHERTLILIQCPVAAVAAVAARSQTLLGVGT